MKLNFLRKVSAVISLSFLLIFAFSGCEAEASSKEETKLISIEIENEPTRTEFTQGDVLDLSGLTVYALYSDSSRKMILDYSVNPAESSVLNTTGKITVTVSYQGKTAKFSINVNKKQDNGPSLTAIEILSLPDKTEYTEGENFSTNGLVLQGTYSDGTKENLSGWSTSPRNGAELSEMGSKTVTVTYGTFTKTFTITVKAKPAVISDSFFWGTWVRMDTGEQYEVLESSVKKIGKNSSTSYKITSASGDASGASDTSPSRSCTVLPSEMPYITVETLGTFVKESDSVIKNGDIPYFRNGGTNLDYSLKIVGFSNSRAVSSAVSGLKGTGKSNKFSSFKSEGESGSDGLLKLTAPTINDVQTVTLDLNDGNGGLIIIPDIMVSNNGDYMGTVALVDEDQYNLKISGEISNKDEGYLFGNGAKTYEMTLTITNISQNNCSSSVCTIEAADSRLSLSSTDIENLNAFYISTLKKNSSKSVVLNLSFGDMTEAYIDTGIKVTIRNSKSNLEWEDYVPLRFYKGMIPITVAAKSPEKNDQAALNGFIIYPDGNNKFFSVKNNESEIVFVPTFGLGEDKRYKIVFSGATVTQELSDSTEMCYSVNPGKSTEKVIDLSTGDWKVLQSYQNFGGDNQSEDKAYPAESEFIGFLSEGEIDYYTISADSDEFYGPGAKSFYRVSFVSDYGTVPSSFLVSEGSRIPSEKLPELTNEGMDFIGWYDGSTLVKTDKYTVYDDVTLSARWNYTEYSVAYELNGGTNASGNPSVITIKTAETTLKAPTRTGYDFKGWYLSEDFNGDEVTKIAGGAIGSIKLYAKWEATKYQITYVLNGGTTGSADEARNDKDNPDSYTIEQTVSIKPATREGYAFAGWFTSASFNGNKISSIEKGSTGSLTLYARWLKRCTVNYVSDHGTAPTSIIKGETDTFTEKELPALKADGWFFKGWYASDGEGGTVKVEADSYVIQENLTLTAKWVQACTISYNSEKASCDVPSSIVVEEGSQLTAKELPSLKERGFKFKGWYFGGTKINIGDEITTNFNLTAQWEEFNDGFVLVEGGTFQMGSTSGNSDEKPVHSVTVTDFYISPYETTQKLYTEVMGTNPSNFRSNPASGDTQELRPVETVSWYDAIYFCNKYSEKEVLTPCYKVSDSADVSTWGYTPHKDNSISGTITCDFTADGYRLPTEAEWEYAAKGGKKSQGYTYSGSNTVGDVAWYNINSQNITHQVGTRNKNELDLYDMSGNVWEWCWDWYGSYSSDSATDPTGASSGTYRVLRGGRWYDLASYLRVAYRACTYPYCRSSINDRNFGFRLVRSATN